MDLWDTFCAIVLPIIIIGGGLIYIIYKLLHDSEVKNETIIYSDVASIDFFKKEGFTVSKEIALDMPSVNQTLKFVVDDYSKRFGFYSYDSSTKFCSLESWKYTDLLNFNLVEDGDQLIPGRGLMAAGGAFMFGLTGAVVGSVAGDRRIQNMCNHMAVQIQVNDLNKPLISIGLIAFQCDKNGGTYSRAKNLGNQIIATLTYIEANKNTPPTEPPKQQQEGKTKQGSKEQYKKPNLDMKDFLS